MIVCLFYALYVFVCLTVPISAVIGYRVYLSVFWYLNCRIKISSSFSVLKYHAVLYEWVFFTMLQSVRIFYINWSTYAFMILGIFRGQTVFRLLLTLSVLANVRGGLRCTFAVIRASNDFARLCCWFERVRYRHCCRLAFYIYNSLHLVNTVAILLQVANLPTFIFKKLVLSDWGVNYSSILFPWCNVCIACYATQTKDIVDRYSQWLRFFVFLGIFYLLVYMPYLHILPIVGMASKKETSVYVLSPEFRVYEVRPLFGDFLN